MQVAEPVWEAVAVRTTRRGNFWVPGNRVMVDTKSCQRGAMYVSWEAPAQVTGSHPVILVHGGAVQGTEWLDTPDGLTAAPITYDPPRATAEKARAADPSTLQIRALRDLPVAVVAGETSPQAGYAPDLVRSLRTAGAAADLIHLPELGIYGNGHGLIYEKNSDEALQPVLRWLAALPDRTAGGHQHRPAVRPAR